MTFKKIRSAVGKLITENQQTRIIIWLSEIFWWARKFFLGVEIDYPSDFLDNWKKIKKQTSQDRARNFTLYQIIKFHNKIFEGKQTNVIEFGVDLGASVTTIARFIKKNTNIYAIDSFGLHDDSIKKNVSEYDEHYHGSYKPFTKETRFGDFSYIQMTRNINDEINKKNSKLETIAGFFPKLDENSMKKISEIKFSFVHLDLDLYQSTIDSFKFVKSRLEKNAIILIDDYNFINQEGVKKAINEMKVDLDRTFQTQGGQLIIYT